MRREYLIGFALIVAGLWPLHAAAQKYAAIFNFGDSLADAGNLVVDGIPEYLATARLPYGMTYFGYPTGRVSDGRLVVDFIAQELGLPLLPPSKAHNASFHRGANFAITGGTSLDTSFFEARGMRHTGAVELVVPGVLPIGCFPVYLSIFLKQQPEMYGPRSGCIKDLNTLSWVHNALLQRKIAELRKKHPGVRIMYADYYTAVTQFVLHADNWGFLQQTPRTCCGAPGVGVYNFNLTSKCGEPGAYACDDPSNHWNWDGVHLTEAAYGHIAKGWLYGPFADPPILEA
uniref:GDSL esterase/lipase n=1 Tax=Aegilops tauschii subsp. strangulata TaxID=200361 RepID=A0A453EEB0_AEGTS